MRNSLDRSNSTLDIQYVKPGTLVYYETVFNGLVPAKYIGADESNSVLIIRFTATRGGYKKYEYCTASPNAVILRSQVRVKRGQFYVTPMPLDFGE